MPETEPKTHEITVKLSATATVIDPATSLRHEPGSEVTIPSDKYGNPLSRHWRRKISAGDCSPIEDETKKKKKGSKKS